MIKLYKLKKIIAVLNPLCISICAALLLDLKSNINCEYILGLFSFFIFYVISNVLYNRCNNYGRIYDIEINEYLKNNCVGTEPERKTIYEKGENRLKKEKKILVLFQYYGFVIFGILGLFCIILNYVSLVDQSVEPKNQNTVLQQQIGVVEYQADYQEIDNLEQANKVIGAQDTIKNNGLTMPEQRDVDYFDPLEKVNN